MDRLRKIQVISYYATRLEGDECPVCGLQKDELRDLVAADDARTDEPPGEAERLLRSLCEDLGGTPPASQSSSIHDIALWYGALVTRLREEKDAAVFNYSWIAEGAGLALMMSREDVEKHLAAQRKAAGERDELLAALRRLPVGSTNASPDERVGHALDLLYRASTDLAVVALSLGLDSSAAGENVLEMAKATILDRDEAVRVANALTGEARQKAAEMSAAARDGIPDSRLEEMNAMGESLAAWRPSSGEIAAHLRHVYRGVLYRARAYSYLCESRAGINTGISDVHLPDGPIVIFSTSNSLHLN